MIYVHIPFCRSFCTYCGFYSEVAGPGKDAERFESYVDALVAEAAERRDEISATLDTDTLYIGGGTPSVLPLSLLQRIVSALPYGPFGEFTIEVNPEDIVSKGIDYARGLRELGVTRVSMGIQSFDDCTLRWMNRRHDSSRAHEAFGILRAAGFGNISIDLIFGVPSSAAGRDGESLESCLERWRSTIREAVEMHPQHISAYQLSIEEGSALERMMSDGRCSEASEEECRLQYDILCEELSQAGYVHYEISNFAQPGFEARHNSAYWSRVPYVGLGAGAHSFDGRRRLWNGELEVHGTCPEACASYQRSSEDLTPEDAVVERIMLALRTAKGAEASWLRSVCGPERVERLVSEGALVETGTMIRIPESRFFVSDDIIRELL